MNTGVMKQTSLTWNNEIKTGALPPGLTARDVESVAGELGHLHIAMSTRGLRLQPGEPAPTHWLLPLNDPEVVRLSANLPGDLLWLSPRRPQSLAGMLVGDFRGAWWEEGLAMVKLNDAVEVYFVPPESPGTGSLATLAQIVALRWAGWPPTQIHETLKIQETNPRSTKLTVSNRTAQLPIA